ncbi:MAG: HEAT repeat domain-containing protein [Planctomycetota bacterium]|nr:HEAT repeat domain-containing protein [Planctomycetota bacterium]
MLWRATILCGLSAVLAIGAAAAEPEADSAGAGAAPGTAEEENNKAAEEEEQPGAGEAAKATAAAAESEEDEKEAAKEKSAVTRPVRSEDLRPWISKLDKGTEEERQKAYEALLAGGAATAKFMRFGLRYYNRFQRLAGVKILQHIHTADSRLALADRALYDRDREVRKAAAAAIREMGGKTARAYIIAKAMSENKSTMEKAARAIANIGDITYIDCLVAEYKEYVAGSVRVNGRLSAYDPARSRTETMRRTTVTGGTTGARTVGTVDMPIDLPVVETVQFSTTVFVFCEITGQKDIKDMEGAIAWWRAHRDDFKFIDLDK